MVHLPDGSHRQIRNFLSTTIITADIDGFESRHGDRGAESLPAEDWPEDDAATQAETQRAAAPLHTQRVDEAVIHGDLNVVRPF